MELFVYTWEYRYGSIYGHCLNKHGEYRIIEVINYKPYCYVEGDRILPSSIIPTRVQRVEMATSLDISTKRVFYKTWFSSYSDMDKYAKAHRNVCFMHEIQPTTMFLSQMGLDTVGWVSVPPPGHKRVNAEDIKQLLNLPPYGSPKIMAFDIEVRSNDMTMPKAYRKDDTIEMISVLCNNVYILHKCDSVLGIEGEMRFDTEYELIVSFFDLIRSENPDVITGYNIFGFDFDYILSRLKRILAAIPDVGRGVTQTVDVVKVDWASSAYGSNRYDRLVINGRLIIDMYLYFKRLKLDKYSLEFVSNKFLGEGKHDMNFNKMMSAIETQDLDSLREVAAYCIRDSKLVLMLFEKVDMWFDVCEMAKVTRCSIEEIYTRGEQMKVVAQCVKECIDRQIVLKPHQAQENDDWHKYEGAYVVPPVRGMYSNCVLLDFRSLYPSIIIAYNICPSTYTPSHGSGDLLAPGFPILDHNFITTEVGLFPGMVKRLLEERATVKAQMHAITDKSSILYTVLNRRQNALKICANSVYGIMGFKRSKYFGNVACAESVTSIGRQYLEKVIKDIESEYSLNVIYGDTDSCLIHMPQLDETNAVKLAKNICKYISAKLPKPMALAFESYYKSAILLSKKRYIMVDSAGNVESKGVMTARRNYCKYAKDMYSDIVNIMTANTGCVDTIMATVEYIDNRIGRLLTGDYDLNELVITTSVKELDSYKTNQPHVVMAKRLVRIGMHIPPGTRLEYVFVKNGHVQSDKMVTPEEYLQGRYEIDALYYISKQIISQVDDLLAVIGINGYIKNKYLF